MRRVRGAVVAGAVLLAASGPAPAAEPPRPAALANGCFSLASALDGRFVRAGGAGGYRASATSARRALPFHLKPTGNGIYMVHDRDGRLVTVAGDASVTRDAAPGPAAEWVIRPAAGGRFLLRSTSTSRALAVDRATRTLVAAGPGARRAARFRLARARGCREYPEAGLGARGRTFRGRLANGQVLGLADAHMHVTADLRAGGQVISGASFDRFGITEALGRDADVHGPDGSLDVTGNLLRSGSPAGTHDTTGWPTFLGWPHHETYTHQQVYYRWLQRAWMGGLRLLVAQTVEDEPLCQIEPRRSHSCDEMDTIELQVGVLRRLQEYVDAQSGGPGRGWFRLVHSPRVARRVIERGQLAVVIGAESSNPFGCSQFRGQPNCDRGDIERGIDRLKRLGVRTLFPAHWVDNALAGAALEGGDKGVFIGGMQSSYTGEPFTTGPCPEEGQGEEMLPLPGRRCNTKALTELGTYAIERLMDAGMLIEADHMSEPARRQLLAMAEARRYPLVSSHTHTGGTWTESELRRLFALGGFATARAAGARELPGTVLGFRDLAGSGPPGVGLATDTGGFAALPAPDTAGDRVPLGYPFRSYDGAMTFRRQQTGERTFDLNADGMAHYGLLPDLLADVARRPDGRRALDVLFHSAEAYLRMWERANARSGG